MKDWGVGVGGGVGLYCITILGTGSHFILGTGFFALKFWALGFGFEKFWLKDSCIPKFMYLKLLFMMLMDNLQFGFRVLVYPKLWCRIRDSIIPKLTVEKEKSLNPLTPESD